jgi:glycosyltransferase involved in cell wall biosynthesis
MWGRRTHAEARALIHSICRERRIDVAHLAWTEMGRYLDAVPTGVATVLGTLDVEHRVRPREVRLHPLGWARMQAARRARRLIQGERRYVTQAHVTLACSAADRRHLAQLADASRIHVVAPWVDLGALHDVKPESVVPGRLTFVGALDRVANEASVRFLLEKVWPWVKHTHTGTVLAIVGANTPQWLRRRAGADSRLVVTGYVADTAKEWAKTDVAVCPSLIGGGLVVKVAQAMAAGRPVVTTSLGNEGVGAPVGEAVAVADDPEAFVVAVQQLLSDRARWQSTAEAGRRHVVRVLDWGASMQDLEMAYAAAIEREKQAV